MTSVEATEPLVCDLGHPITKRKAGLRGWQFDKMFGLVEQVCRVCHQELATDDIRWRCHNACNFDICEPCYVAKAAGTAPDCEPVQFVDISMQDAVTEINLQRTKVAAVFEVALPLLQQRKDELEVQFKRKGSEVGQGPDALAFSQLLRLRGVGGKSPLEKYQAILDELKDPSMPEIDAAFIQHVPSEGLEEIREKLRRLNEAADECQSCVHEVGAA